MKQGCLELRSEGGVRGVARYGTQVGETWSEEGEGSSSREDEGRERTSL